MGWFSRIFSNGPGGEGAEPEPLDAPPAAPDVVALCRHGMTLPSAQEIDEVLGLAFPTPLPEAVHRVGLAQPSWFKNAEVTESAAADVAAAMAHKFGFASYDHRYRTIDRPRAPRVLLVEVCRDDLE